MADSLEEKRAEMNASIGELARWTTEFKIQLGACTERNKSRLQKLEGMMRKSHQELSRTLILLRGKDRCIAEVVLDSTQFYLNILRTVRDLGHELSGNLLRKQHFTPGKWNEIETLQSAAHNKNGEIPL